MKTLREVLDEVPDPRSRHGRRHPLGAILALAICAMFCSARSLYAIAQWGKDQGVPMAKRPRPVGAETDTGRVDATAGIFQT